MGNGRTRIVCVLVVFVVLTGTETLASERAEPFFGEALYYAHQGRHFDALQRLDAELAQHRKVDEPELDPFYVHLHDAEFSVGDFELHYRMHHRAGRAITAVLQAEVPAPVRNEASYRLARIQFEKNRFNEALLVLDGMRGDVTDKVRNDAAYLRANIYISTGRADEAVELLRSIRGSDGLEGFADFNLGIALLRADRSEDALRQLDRAGRVDATDPAGLAVRDRANLTLGTLLLDASRFDLAQKSFDRVRLQGLYTNQALLSSGWAAASASEFDRAVVPWRILASRDSTDPSVQEVLVALPHAYSELGIHGRAAQLYEHAVDTFTNELTKLDASSESISGGDFLEALGREEILRDEDWVVRLRSLPDAPETFYLIQLMASHDFQTSLQNYLDLIDLRRRLKTWELSLAAFEDLIRLRQRYYEPILPSIDERFRALDAKIRLRLEQREHIARNLDQMLVSPRPDQLTTASESALQERLAYLDSMLGASNDADADRLRARIRRLQGHLNWQIDNGYHERLTEAHARLRELTQHVEAMQTQYGAFVRARQAATHGFAGRQVGIDDLRVRVRRSLEGVETLMERQGIVLEKIALRELEARRGRIAAQQNQARFAFADSYYRAVRAQAKVP